MHGIALVQQPCYLIILHSSLLFSFLVLAFFSSIRRKELGLKGFSCLNWKLNSWSYGWSASVACSCFATSCAIGVDSAEISTDESCKGLEALRRASSVLGCFTKGNGSGIVDG